MDACPDFDDLAQRIEIGVEQLELALADLRQGGLSGDGHQANSRDGILPRTTEVPIP